MVIFGSILTVLILAIGFLVFRLVMPKDVEDLPRAAADYVEVIDSISTPKIKVPNETTPSDGGVIRTSDLTAQIDSVGEVESVEIRRGQQNQPAEGHKFMVITLSYDASTNRDGADTTFALDINGTRVPLEDVVSRYQFGTQIVASVPDDDSARLVVTYADYDQFFSVATGERTPDPVTDQYYRAERFVEHPELATTPTQVYAGGAQGYYTFEPQSATYSVTRALAAVSPYNSNIGWAQPGAVWFLFEYQDYLQYDYGPYMAPGFSLDTKWVDRSLVVTADGAQVTQVIDGIDSTPSVGGDWAYREVWITVFSVPATAQNISVSITVSPTFTSMYDVADKTVTMPTLTFDSSFPL